MDTWGRWMSLVFVLGLAVVGTQAQCAPQELNLLFECIVPYNDKFIQAIGRGSSCDRSRISNAICTDFAAIVTCVNNKPVSRTTCRPFAVGQINSHLEIPCEIRDFEDVCKNAPAIDKATDGIYERTALIDLGGTEACVGKPVPFPVIPFSTVNVDNNGHVIANTVLDSGEK